MSIEDTIRKIVREEVTKVLEDLIIKLEIKTTHDTYRSVLTLKEAAEMLRVSTDTLYLMVQRNEIPHSRVRRRILFRKDDLLEWMSKHTDNIKK